MNTRNFLKIVALASSLLAGCGTSTLRSIESITPAP